jgi:hypothetical protein
MMKLLRLTLVCSLLLLAAAPSFALPCNSCTGPEYPYCESSPGSGTRCRFGIDTCTTIYAPNCTGFTDQGADPAMLAEWTVASIEVSRSVEGTKVVTSPAAIADAGISQTAGRK